MRELTARELAARLDGDLVGTGDVRVRGIAALDEAEPHHASFLGNPRYRKQVVTSRAGVVIVPRDFEPEPPAGRAWIKCAKPSSAFTEVVLLFAPPPVVPPPGVHAKAVVAAGVVVPPSCHVGPYAVLETGVRLGAHTAIEAGSYVGQDTVIGEHCRIYPGVIIRERCKVGNRVIIHPGTVIGSDGYGYEPSPTGHKKIPQVGIVQLDDDVEVGANVTIDRARFGRTWIKAGVKIDNLVQIAHNVEIGEHSFIVAQVGIAGSVRVGKGVSLAGQVGVPGHITIGDGAIIMGKSGPISDVAPGERLLGIPAVPYRQFMKQTALMQHLPELFERMRKLEQEVAEIQQRHALLDDQATANGTPLPGKD